MSDNYEKCSRCGALINVANSVIPFYRHLSEHNNPLSVYCHEWYKPYFKASDNDKARCVTCGKLFKHETDYPMSQTTYVQHLREHGIKFSLRL